MKMRKIYEPPVVKVIRVVCEEGIAIQSYSQITIEVDDWEDDPDASDDADQDIYIPF